MAAVGLSAVFPRHRNDSIRVVDRGEGLYSVAAVAPFERDASDAGIRAPTPILSGAGVLNRAVGAALYAAAELIPAQSELENHLPNRQQCMHRLLTFYTFELTFGSAALHSRRRDGFERIHTT